MVGYWPIVGVVTMSSGARCLVKAGRNIAQSSPVAYLFHNLAFANAMLAEQV
jgi:hypothetical protein